MADRSLALAVLALTAVALGGCTGFAPPGHPPLPPVPTAAPAAKPAASPPATPTPQPPAGSSSSSPSGPPPWATVIKDARRIEGVITAWQKDEKLWLELRPEDLGRPFLLTPKVKSGIGEGMLVGGLMQYPVSGAGGSQVVEFVRVHNTIRLVSRNMDVRAREGTPQARAVQSTYGSSLLGATQVASQPHPERKSILIDGAALFLGDPAGMGMQLQRQFRQGYSLDRGNSLVTEVRGTAGALVIETQSHYYTASVATPQVGGVPGAPLPTVPRFLPDTRSLLIGQHFSLVALPEKPMAPRRADPRVGLFSTAVLDFSDDLARTPRKRMIHRWRLEKKDPAAEVSDVVRPVTFWIDRNVPLEYRDTIRGAILEWNRAFEAIGLRGAIAVEQQADDAAFDTLDPGYASVRWLMSADPVISAIGQSDVDPRSGEILDADIAVEAMAVRAQRYARTQLLSAAAPSGGGRPERGTGTLAEPHRPDLGASARGEAPPPFAVPWGWPAGPAGDVAAHAYCQHGDLVAVQAAYALDVLEARGELAGDGERARQFVLDYLKDTVMHEVGHALGLRHNFRASRVYTEEQLADPEFTRAHGTTGSVMEYNAVNLARPGESGGVPFQLTLGPYDYWAIDYGYRPLPSGATAADEEALLQRVAARSHEPLLAFGTDEDASFGIDAETIQLDLGADPLAFAEKRLEIARDLFRRQETRELPLDRDYSVLRRSLAYALGDAARAVGVLARQIGGLRTLRDYPGTGRDPLAPVPADVQRQAFEAITRAVFAADGLTVSPALQRRLAPDYLDRGEIPGLPTDFNLPARLLDMQRSMLGYLLSDALATRVLDALDKLDQPAAGFQLAELYARLSRDLWSELDYALTVPAARRELQRDFVNRVALTVLRPGARADARGALRHEAQGLLARLESALKRKGLDEATRLHWADSADSLRQAFAARLPRVGI